MADGGHGSVARHLAGLSVAAGLGLGCYGLYLVVPMLIRGTFLQRVENIAIFLSMIALLGVAERVWVMVMARLHRHPPE